MAYHVKGFEAHGDSDTSGKTIVHTRTHDEVIRVFEKLAQTGASFGDGHSGYLIECEKASLWSKR